MGRFLECGIAKTIKVEKDRYSKEEILNKLAKSVDLDIYEAIEEREKYFELELKKDIMEKYAVKFIEEQLKIAGQDINEICGDKISLKDLENQKYDELMEIADEKECYNFQLLDCLFGFSNDISYITEDLFICADIIAFLGDGKIIMECYNDVFGYFRNQVIKNSNNPIKTAMVVTIIWLGVKEFKNNKF